MIRLLVLLPLVSACAVGDSRLAHRAADRLVGLSEVDLEACLGVPDQHSSFGATDILTYTATSSSSTSYSIPVVGGVGLSNGGYCHATFRVDNGRVSHVLYSGEKNATLAPDAYCAPIVRSCLGYLASHPATQAGTAISTGNHASETGTVAPGGTSAAPQPGASTAGRASSMPVPTPAAP